MENSQSVPNRSEELLSNALVITKSLYNYVLLAIILGAIVALLWGFWGTIPQKIEGIGIIGTKDGLHEINTLYGGQISEVYSKVNDYVNKGDIVIIVRQPDMESKINELKTSINQLQLKKDLIQSGNITNSNIKSKVDDLGIKGLKDKISKNKETIAYLEKKVSQEQKMFEKGLITYSQYFETQNDLNDANVDEIKLNEQLALISLNTEEWKLNKDLTEKEIQSSLISSQEDLKDLESEYKLRTEVVAKASGLIKQINVKKGDIVSSDEVLAIIDVEETDYKDYILNLYVPFNSNELITNGMSVDVEPFNVDHNLYGWLKGTVIQVDHIVSSTNSLFNDLANEDLESLIKSKGPVYKVLVKLKTDKKTISGFAWSNKKGPPYKIHPGQITNAYINVKEKAPVDYLLPIFKEYFD